MASELAIPRLTLYSCSKAFLNRLAISLEAEERFDGNTDISFMYFGVGSVVTNALTKPVTFMCPSSEVFSKALVGSLGCGRQEVIPYIGHTILYGLSRLLPRWLQAMIIAKEMKMFLEATKKKRKEDL
jgi:short-subunit dehydrogenase